jgi:ADP-ribosylglycohydrolase
MFRQEEYTEPGDKFNNGNGSLMRLAPVPVAFIDDIEKGI